MLAVLSRRDGPIRLTGVAGFIAGITCLQVLFGGRIAPIGWTGFMAACAGFLGCSGGALLMTLGARIHDRVPVARPWGAQLSS